MLDASNQVRDKLVDGPFVLHRPRNSLGHFDFVSLTVGRNMKLPQGLDQMQGMGLTCRPSYLKYRLWLPRCLSMASREPMPRYFFSRIPSEKKYSPGASVVAAKREPIMTVDREVS